MKKVQLIRKTKNLKDERGTIVREKNLIKGKKDMKTKKIHRKKKCIMVKDIKKMIRKIKI